MFYFYVLGYHLNVLLKNSNYFTVDNYKTKRQKLLIKNSSTKYKYVCYCNNENYKKNTPPKRSACGKDPMMMDVLSLGIAINRSVLGSPSIDQPGLSTGIKYKVVFL